MALIQVTGMSLLLAIGFPDSSACVVSSGPQRVALLELYTSESCSSCPPADNWISRLPAKHLMADRVIPLSFHVDYQDDARWTDAYGQSRFSQRQILLDNRRGTSRISTPQFLLNGQDYQRGIIFDDIAGEIRKINGTAPEAVIKLEIEPAPASLAGTVDVSVATSALQNQPQVFLALSENDLTSVVAGGENGGRTLHHDYVVRELIGPLALDVQGHLHSRYSFQLKPAWKTQNLRLAAYVQDVHDNVLQVVSGTCNQAP